MAITDPPYGYYPNNVVYYPHYYTYYPGPQPIQQGWECPKCGRVYSPSMIMCSYCGNSNKLDKLTITTTNSNE